MNAVINVLDRMSQLQARFDKYFPQKDRFKLANNLSDTAKPTARPAPATAPNIATSLTKNSSFINDFQSALNVSRLTGLQNTSAAALAGNYSASNATQRLNTNNSYANVPLQAPYLPTSPQITSGEEIALARTVNSLTASSAAKLSVPTQQANHALATTQTPKATKAAAGAHAALAEPSFPYKNEITRAARKYDLPVALIRSVVQAESNFNPFAISHKGALGLMQLMPQTVKQLGVTNPFHVEENLLGGTKYLRLLLDQYKGDYTKALAAYNAGGGAVERAVSTTGKSVPPYNETNDYIKKVLTNYMKYSGVR